jgi:hypothetical protein
MGARHSKPSMSTTLTVAANLFGLAKAPSETGYSPRSALRRRPPITDEMSASAYSSLTAISNAAFIGRRLPNDESW